MKKVVRFLLILACLGILAFPSSRRGAAAPANGASIENGMGLLVMVADPNPAMQGIQAPTEPAVQAAIAGAATPSTFTMTFAANGSTDPLNSSVTCLTFPDNAKTAFAAAASIWATTLVSSVPITVSACWANLGSSSILGYSGGGSSYRDFTGAPQAHVWYESSLANALHGSDLDATKFDDYITFNTNFSWYYGTDGHPTAGTYDLVSVAAHEIGHGLNISGTASYSSGSGSYGMGTGYPNIYDTFMENSGGTKMTTLTNPSAALGSLLISNSLWFNGPYADAANGGVRVKIYAPVTWASGSSYSHIDYNTFAGTANSMMVYAIGSGSAQHNPGPVTKGLLKDLGWRLASDIPTTSYFLPLIIQP